MGYTVAILNIFVKVTKNGQEGISTKITHILIEWYQTRGYNAISHSIPLCTTKSIANPEFGLGML